jgi:hypothetical protein
MEAIIPISFSREVIKVTSIIKKCGLVLIEKY